jgi:hypothetical protein
VNWCEGCIPSSGCTRCRRRDWPFIPQLFVNGEFIGGCDIVREKHEAGELKPLLDSAKRPGTTDTGGTHGKPHHS